MGFTYESHNVPIGWIRKISERVIVIVLTKNLALYGEPAKSAEFGQKFGTHPPQKQ